TTTFKIIQLLKHLELSIHAHSDIMQPYTIDLPYTPLENILQTHTNYPIFKRQLRSKHIIFLEQLTSFDNSVLLTWEHISPRINSLIPGKIPKWFTILENKITTNSITRQLISTLQLPSVNSLSYTTGHFNTKNKPWLITYKEQTIIMGKARRSNKQILFPLHTGLLKLMKPRQHYTQLLILSAIHVQVVLLIQKEFKAVALL